MDTGESPAGDAPSGDPCVAPQLVNRQGTCSVSVRPIVNCITSPLDEEERRGEGEKEEDRKRRERRKEKEKQR